VGAGYSSGKPYERPSPMTEARESADLIDHPPGLGAALDAMRAADGPAETPLIRGSEAMLPPIWQRPGGAR
jgi:hypothetical protein